MRVFEDTIFSDTVNNETVNGESIHLDHIMMFSVHVVWTGGSANGSVKLQASNDELTWADIDGTTVTISGAGDQLYNDTSASFKFVRVSVTASDANDIVTRAKIYAKGW